MDEPQPNPVPSLPALGAPQHVATRDEAKPLLKLLGRMLSPKPKIRTHLPRTKKKKTAYY